MSSNLAGHAKKLTGEIKSVVQIDCVDDSVQDATITNLPMYDEDKKIPRA